MRGSYNSAAAAGPSFMVTISLEMLHFKRAVVRTKNPLDTATLHLTTTKFSLCATPVRSGTNTVPNGPIQHNQQWVAGDERLPSPSIAEST